MKRWWLAFLAIAILFPLTCGRAARAERIDMAAFRAAFNEKTGGAFAMDEISGGGDVLFACVSGNMAQSMVFLCPPDGSALHLTCVDPDGGSLREANLEAFCEVLAVEIAALSDADAADAARYAGQLVEQGALSLDGAEYVCGFSTADTLLVTVTPSDAALRRGDEGQAVRALQDALSHAGYLAAEPNGVYDAATVVAVKAMQTACGLAVTGEADDAFMRALRDIAGTAESAPVIDDETDPAPVIDDETDPAPVIDDETDPAPVIDEETDPAPVIDEETDPAPVTDEETDPAPAVADDADASRVWRRGDRGDTVREIQGMLVKLGHLYGRPDGQYGRYTAAAVRELQRAWGFVPTGEVDGTLLRYMRALTTEGEDAARSLRNRTTILREGDAGTAVSVLQRRLAALGYFSGATDGRYGADTATAVKALQTALELPPTGEADAAVLNALSDARATLMRGDRGEDVAALQSLLLRGGYMFGIVDGYYGARTQKAVRAAQRALSMPATGEADAEFQKALAEKSPRS